MYDDRFSCSGCGKKIDGKPTIWFNQAWHHPCYLERIKPLDNEVKRLTLLLKDNKVMRKFRFFIKTLTLENTLQK